MDWVPKVATTNIGKKEKWKKRKNGKIGKLENCKNGKMEKWKNKEVGKIGKLEKLKNKKNGKIIHYHSNEGISRMVN